MKKILITGGNGYVGKELINTIQNTYKVHVADKNLNRIKNKKYKKIKLHKINLTKNKETKLLINKINPDIIINLAATHFIPECEKYPDLCFANNVLTVINLMKNIDKKCKFIHISSASVYKHSKSSLKENTSPIKPSDIYGISKLQSEQVVNHYGNKKNIDYLIVRLFNVIGPGETNPHFVPEIISQLKKNKNKIKLGNTKTKRDFIDVRDVANALSKLCKKKFSLLNDNRVLNLGSGNTVSLKKILTIMKKFTDSNFKIITDKNKLRINDNPIILSSTKKIRKFIDWNVKYDLKTSLKDTWESKELPPSVE